jgi:translation initiation factor 6 (eIF-6)
MAVRAQFENSNEIGVFSMLTNSYALVAIGNNILLEVSYHAPKLFAF